MRVNVLLIVFFSSPQARSVRVVQLLDELIDGVQYASEDSVMLVCQLAYMPCVCVRVCVCDVSLGSMHIASSDRKA